MGRELGQVAPTSRRWAAVTIRKHDRNNSDAEEPDAAPVRPSLSPIAIVVSAL